MDRLVVLTFSLLLGLAPLLAFGQKLEEDIIKTSAGDLKITFIGHASLMFTFGDKIIHVDPVTDEGNYKQLPQADLILITHDHYDHLDSEALKILKKDSTMIVGPANCQSKAPDLKVMKNGDRLNLLGLDVEAVPAYNLVHKRPDGQPFHPRGTGNGYVITFGDKRVYVAGDTENIPEMKNLQNIDIAFLPMNLPYTMTPEMVAEAARWIKPKVLYPYHYGDTDTSRLVNLLKNTPEIEVRIRRMK
ncbi:MAG TPA: MBL fold metallo-hydrolase [Candidatus Saccharicenans sp.]|nr:MBL fold metallo-hydrolase [Candidatus Saccharicenans sp.]HRD01076.1 MBL fold metallo-hydrolase [Candidatus Saccharicenans sp.]